MATGKSEFVEVEKTVIEKERVITLTLNRREAQYLRGLISTVTGELIAANHLRDALREAGIYLTDGAVFAGTVKFIKF